MGQYTISVKSICEMYNNLSDPAGFNDVETVIRNAAPKIFNFDFPIYDENHRLELECNILRHYYMREICCETIAMWQLYLSSTLNDIMPHYNMVYKSIDLVNPITNNSMRENIDQTVNSNLKITHGGKDKTTDRYSDTPQGSLINIESNEYLTNARITDFEDHKTDSHSGGDHTTAENVRDGYTTSPGKLLTEWNEEIRSVDYMIIEELSDCFFGLWQ